jgi:ribosomal protein L11 methylase PrmA
VPQDPASFRDPAGHVHVRDGRVLRTVLPSGVDNYQLARESGFFQAATGDGRLIEGHEVDPAILRDEAPGAAYVIEHPRLDFISYPYEWSFYGLRAAALLTLDLHLEALRRGLTMSDASAFNIQFSGPRPVFIDYLSVIRYQPGQVWLGYRQFCEQFLNPLLFTATTGVAFQPWYRGTLQGIRSNELAAVLPFRAKLDPRVALHVVLQGRLQRTVTASETRVARSVRLPKSALENNVRGLQGWITRLKPPRAQVTPWQEYDKTARYNPEERAGKSRFVAEVVGGARPRVVWDLGCNSGEYAEVALAHGATLVIGFEPDPGALNAAYQRAVSRKLEFLPLSVDLTNPSPDLGWRERERAGIGARRGADLILCLALLHHLVLGNNLPFSQVIDWLVSLAPRGIVEFVP